MIFKPLIDFSGIITQFSVSKNVRGLGIGRKLCDHIEMLARKDNRNLYLGQSNFSPVYKTRL